MLEDLGTGVANFLDNGPRTASLFQRTIGPILSQRPLPSGKFLIGCRSRQQQEALFKTKVLGGVNVACSIPQPTTEGVIRPVPTVPVCPRCGNRGHTPGVCPNKLCCLNCGGPHSAAYQKVSAACPQQRLRLIANRIRSGTFIPYSEALKRAHVEVEDRKKPLQPIAETAPHDPFWCEEPAVSKTFEPQKRSYADAAGNKVQTCVSCTEKTHCTGRQGPKN